MTLVAGLAIFARGNTLLAAFLPATDPTYVITVAYRMQQPNEPLHDVHALAEYITKPSVNAVTVGKLEVRKT